MLATKGFTRMSADSSVRGTGGALTASILEQHSNNKVTIYRKQDGLQTKTSIRRVSVATCDSAMCKGCAQQSAKLETVSSVRVSHQDVLEGL